MNFFQIEKNLQFSEIQWVQIINSCRRVCDKNKKKVETKQKNILGCTLWTALDKVHRYRYIIITHSHTVKKRCNGVISAITHQKICTIKMSIYRE